MKIQKTKIKDFEKAQKIVYDAVDSVKISKKQKEHLRKKYSFNNLKILHKKCDMLLTTKNNIIYGTGKLCKHEIGMIYVNPRFHKKGFGTKMMNHLESLARKKKLKYVYVNALIPATGFYKKLGYKVIKKTKEHYKMIKNLR